MSRIPLLFNQYPVAPVPDLVLWGGGLALLAYAAYRIQARSVVRPEDAPAHAISIPPNLQYTPLRDHIFNVGGERDTTVAKRCVVGQNGVCKEIHTLSSGTSVEVYPIASVASVMPSVSSR